MLTRPIIPLYCSLLLLLNCIPANGQTTQKAENTEVTSEWFLATGNWYSDPKLYMRTIGTGKDTVVLLHGGWGGEHRGLIASTRGLEDKYLFVLYDQRGSLRSPFPDSTISFNNHIEDLERIRKELRVSRLKIAGHSMGALLAAAYHDKYPHRVKSLTLLAPAPLRIPLPPEYKPLSEASNEKVPAFLKRPAITDELKKLNLLREHPPLSSREETFKFRISFASRFLYNISRWREIGGGGPYYNARTDELTSQTMPSGWDYYKNFRESKTPVSVILGDHDFLDMGATITKKQTEGIPNAEVVVIKNAGHQIWTDQPESFRAQFEKALKK